MFPSSPPPNASSRLRSHGDAPTPTHPTSPPSPGATRTRRAWAWADLMRRGFLAHLGLPTKGPALCPARPPPYPDAFDHA